MNNNTINSILGIVKSCDDLQLCTFGLTGYPETRHLTNGMNKNANDLRLHFFTNVKSPKLQQLIKNPNCCLYYFNSDSRHAVRLFGQMETVADPAVRRTMWRDEYARFGYSGHDDANFILLRFIPDTYKFYVGPELKTGKI